MIQSMRTKWIPVAVRRKLLEEEVVGDKQGGWPFILDQNLVEKLCWPTTASSNAAAVVLQPPGGLTSSQSCQQ